jgi:predicted transcriptional regulator
MDAGIPVRARRVLEILAETGPLSLASLARQFDDASTNEVAMAVGWLAHAGEVCFRRRADLWMIVLQRPVGSGSPACPALSAGEGA